MGRTSKLTAKQWSEVERRLAGGESASALAKTYKVDVSAISRKFSQTIPALKTLAAQMVETDKAFERLPISQKVCVMNIADQLRAIGGNLATAANFGSATAARLHQIANLQVVAMGEGDLVDFGALPAIAALTKVANEAATIGTAFMVANKPKTDPDAGQGKEDLLRDIAAMLPD